MDRRGSEDLHQNNRIRRERCGPAIISKVGDCSRCCLEDRGAVDLDGVGDVVGVLHQHAAPTDPAHVNHPT